MGGINKVFLLGNLENDPDLKSTKSGRSFTTFNMTTTVSWERADGKKGERTEWHKILAWDEIAQECANILSKGSPVYIEGKLQTRSWEEKDGIKKYITEVVAKKLESLDGKRKQRISEEPPLPDDNDATFY